jgi:hypothetical protein
MLPVIVAVTARTALHSRVSLQRICCMRRAHVCPPSTHFWRVCIHVCICHEQQQTSYRVEQLLKAVLRTCCAAACCSGHRCCWHASQTLSLLCPSYYYLPCGRGCYACGVYWCAVVYFWRELWSGLWRRCGRTFGCCRTVGGHTCSCAQAEWCAAPLSSASCRRRLIVSCSSVEVACASAFSAA